MPPQPPPQMSEADASKHQPGLERLPTEVRQKVYGLLGYPVVKNEIAFGDSFHTVRIPVRGQYRFLDGMGEHAHKKISNYLSYRQRGKFLDLHRPLLQVNRAITADLYALLYSETMFTFLFDISSANPVFLSSHALAYLTHVTVGPLLEAADPMDIFSPRRVEALGSSIGFVSGNCPQIEVLGVHILAADLLQLPCNGLSPLYEAISDASMLCAKLKRIIMGLGKLPITTIELAVIPEEERGEEVEDWAITVLAQIQLMVERVRPLEV